MSHYITLLAETFRLANLLSEEVENTIRIFCYRAHEDSACQIQKTMAFIMPLLMKGFLRLDMPLAHKSLLRASAYLEQVREQIQLLPRYTGHEGDWESLDGACKRVVVKLNATLAAIADDAGNEADIRHAPIPSHEKLPSG
jgi:hypothetical protein